MPQNLYEFTWIFIIYAFIGWCTEVSYAALDQGKFVNRGFLNGPYCPIYGFGVVIVVGILTPLKDNLFVLFIGSFLLTSVLEYLTGWILEKVFHNKWWDYSDKPFNLKGYVCLKFSVFWGLGCTFIMQVVHPMIYKLIIWIPEKAGLILIFALISVFIIDSIITISTILKFNKYLRHADEIANSIHRLSDEIGENIYENVTEIIEKKEEFEERHAELIDRMGDVKEEISERIENRVDSIHDKKRQLEELKEHYEMIFNEKNAGFRRLIKAFPSMKISYNQEILDRMKLQINKLEEIKKALKRNEK